MQQQLIRCVKFFQLLLYSNFRQLRPKLVWNLTFAFNRASVRLYNPNQVAGALAIPKANLYRHLKSDIY